MSQSKFQIMDVTLRDGSYAVDFQFSLEDERNICFVLEDSRWEYIELGHGMGIGTSRDKSRKALHSDKEYLKCAQQCIKQAKYGVFCIPGVATMADILLAAEYGCSFIRIGTNVRDVKQSEQYIKCAKKNGLIVMANYMKSYASSIEEFREAVYASAAYGADIIYIVDSAGCMMPSDIERYYNVIKENSNVKTGFHGHNNIGMAIANTLYAVQMGIDFVDSSLQGIGRSTGNTCTEHLAICLKKLGYDLAIDISKLLLLSKKYVSGYMRGGG